MLLSVNSQKLYQSATGKFERTQSLWNEAIINELLGSSSAQKEHPKAVTPSQQWGKKSKASTCRSCWYFDKKDTRTVRHCRACNSYICKKCDESDKHIRFSSRDITLSDTRHRV